MLVSGGLELFTADGPPLGRGRSFRSKGVRTGAWAPWRPAQPRWRSWRAPRRRRQRPPCRGRLPSVLPAIDSAGGDLPRAAIARGRREDGAAWLGSSHPASAPRSVRRGSSWAAAVPRGYQERGGEGESREERRRRGPGSHACSSARASPSLCRWASSTAVASPLRRHANGIRSR
ncbi:hypothetical protein PVAP13_5NG140681 [Panicum virgatum]|uniref:Uncharacterized protein n=1 Tax=Panicum virgatum TaxID=38727 RepID=A0A8T0RQ04_PANVG|nr:hypothetical protein PVAP13_5NG140681 [Panicum virgatum]